MLNIRLARTGRKRDAHFRVVVSDSVHGRVGRIVETLGYYHPRMPNDAEGRLHIKADRARYWLGHGAKPSSTVKSFLKNVLAEPTQSEETQSEETQSEETQSEETQSEETQSEENGSGESGSGTAE